MLSFPFNSEVRSGRRKSNSTPVPHLSPLVYHHQSRARPQFLRELNQLKEEGKGSGGRKSNSTPVPHFSEPSPVSSKIVFLRRRFCITANDSEAQIREEKKKKKERQAFFSLKEKIDLCCVLTAIAKKNDPFLRLLGMKNENFRLASACSREQIME
ncbi:hypothetical protein CEXT_722101 [Caerostris extrusa]|uniref:Cycloidea-like protein n=1 Tax=Caerostris extrusa TaxID=172846 RepID=A0AAV4Y747_CAEEX|nr:hypothetical protein CEXT_722101 [Caerostris extrusa]